MEKNFTLTPKTIKIPPKNIEIIINNKSSASKDDGTEI